MSMKEHVTVVAALRIGMSILVLVAAALVFVGVVGGGLLSGDREAIRITSIVGTVVAGCLALFCVPGIVAGVGLLKHWNWARILTLVLSIFDLLAFPIGTLIAVYSIWVLVQRETEVLFGCCVPPETRV
jgi:p-aminobenzoyl-glutamate transporter AbgT